ncbi:protein B4-like [Podarcis raffonei]|uniref:protein B4-like n=1 Tax=Podarcis raffonei TaxID=65483 RepID=UPI002329719F|nr:protein B4-like [Podarcis raffonei]
MEALSIAKSSASLASPLALLNCPKAQHLPTLTMVMEVVKTLDKRKGVSVVATKCYILGSYPGVDPIHLKYTLAQGLERDCLIRPQNSSTLGATGRFKLGTEEAKGKKSHEKKSDSDGKTAPKLKKAAKNPKLKVPVEKPRQGSITEGEKKEVAPSKNSKAKASRHPGKPPAKPKVKKSPMGEKAAQILKKPSSSKALPANTPGAPRKAVSKESKTEGRGCGAPRKRPRHLQQPRKPKRQRGRKPRLARGPSPPEPKEGENPASRDSKEA